MEHPLGELCPGGFSETYESPPGCAGIGFTFDLNDGRVMGFFRQPEHRLISDWYYRNWEAFYRDQLRPPILQQDVESIQGCAVKSLTRQDKFSRPLWRNPTHFPGEPC